MRDVTVECSPASVISANFQSNATISFSSNFLPQQAVVATTKAESNEVVDANKDISRIKHQTSATPNLFCEITSLTTCSY
jgi:hypothetical protein